MQSSCCTAPSRRAHDLSRRDRRQRLRRLASMPRLRAAPAIRAGRDRLAEQRAQAVATERNIPHAFPSLDAMLAELGDQIDVISIATPPLPAPRRVAGSGRRRQARAVREAARRFDWPTPKRWRPRSSAPGCAAASSSSTATARRRKRCTSWSPTAISRRCARSRSRVSVPSCAPRTPPAPLVVVRLQQRSAGSPTRSCRT